ncbi:hypothetical protein X946_5209 [Burkholderia sp. ABCPW 111]|nr:hypothetical protein X946_5209 [Burkholderia sp. ABCPW 111]
MVSSQSKCQLKRPAVQSQTHIDVVESGLRDHWPLRATGLPSRTQAGLMGDGCNTTSSNRTASKTGRDMDLPWLRFDSRMVRKRGGRGRPIRHRTRPRKGRRQPFCEIR